MTTETVAWHDPSQPWGQFVALSEAEQVARVLEVMAEIVAELGDDHMYPRLTVQEAVDKGWPWTACVYVWDRGNGAQADCIAGRVFARLGVPLPELAAHEGTGAATLGELFGMSEGASTVLCRAQEAQDGHTTASGDEFIIPPVPYGEVLRQARGSAVS